MDLDMDRQLREFIKEARQELREAAGKLTEEEVATADRKKRAADFERELGMKLSAMVSVMALDLKVVFVGDSPVARFRCAGKTFYCRSLNGTWRLSRVDDGVETDTADIQDDDPLFKQRVLVAIGGHI